MANITKVPDLVAENSGTGWGNWQNTEYASSSLVLGFPSEGAYRTQVPGGTAVTVKSCSLTLSLSTLHQEIARYSVYCDLYRNDPHSGSSVISTQTFSSDPAAPATHVFSFSNLNLSQDNLYFVLSASAEDASGTFFMDGISATDPHVSITYEAPALGLTVEPPSTYVGETFTGSITNAIGQTFDVRFTYGDILLQSFSTSATSFSQRADASWFTRAGVTGSSMQVTVSIADDLGRTASVRVTVNKHTARVPSIIQPRSGNYDGGDAILFAWSSAGEGTQKEAELQWSQNGVSWSRLAYVYSAETWTASAGFFPAGAVYWRIKILNSVGVWSDWVSANFNAVYNGAVVTLTTPTSGSHDGGQQIAFAWTISLGSGSLTGTQMEYTADDGLTWISLLNVSSGLTSYNAPAGKFPAGAIKWRVRARDSYAGWGEWKQATITITYASASVTLTTPTSGSRDGADVIAFAWTISLGSGSITGTQMEISTDDGISWQSLINSDGAVTSYASEVAQFPAGRLLWHVRAKDSYSGWGAWKAATITVAYSAVSQAVPVNSPTSGVYNAAAASVFSVALQASGPVHDPFTVSAATFYWRHGESGAFTEAAMTPGGNTASVTIAAGTIPSGLFQWYASVTDTTGRTTQTETYSLTALQSQIEAAPVSPANTVESGSGPIVFRWTYGSLDGSKQGRAQLQYSTDGSTWSDEHIFADIPGEDTIYVAPAGTIPGGTIYWRVRAYNEAGTGGPWSASASFTSYAAPLVQGVTGNGKPFATITWQTEGQEAYEIQVDARTYGPYFGSDVRSYTLPEPLEDGTHIVRVRAQNRYGLWSEWASGEMSVTNVPAGTQLWIMASGGENVHIKVFIGTLAPVILTQPQDAQGTSGEIYYSVLLASTAPGYPSIDRKQWFVKDPGGNWQPFTGSGATGTTMHFTAAQELDGRQIRVRAYNAAGEVYSRTATYRYAAPNTKIGEAITGEFRAETGYFLVYRDGKLIGKTYNEFDDRTVLGGHTYRYVQALPGGYYNSASANAAASVKCPMIAPLEGGDFLALALSENMDRVTQVQLQQEVAWTQYAGAEYPTPEIGEARRKTISLDVSALMQDEAFAKAFDALVGEDVIVKTPDGEVVIGPLEGYDLRAPGSHRAWTFSVQQMEWRDFVDESQTIV